MGIGDSITLGEVLGEGASAVTYKALDANGRSADYAKIGRVAN